MTLIRRAALLLAFSASLAGCGIPFFEPVEGLALASLAAVPLFGRTMPDMLYSGLTGKDCSVVRLEQGKSYCRSPDPPFEPARICTRSLGTVDCWINPEALNSPARPLADAQPPTAEQEAYRTRRWPFF